MDARLHALNRFGLGARPGEARSLDNPKAWLLAQLDGEPPASRVPDQAKPSALAEALHAFRAAGQGSPAERQQARRQLVEISSAEMRAALQTRVTTDRPFVERLVMFWSNHLCVSGAAKQLVVPFAGSYERDAIRPHVLGRFEDMVLASAKHPAMLVYLDNFQSIGPGSPAATLTARRGRDRRGLNENYARELLELHTLGVNGGYGQQDVQELAKVLTGWSVGGLDNGGPLQAMRTARGRGALGRRVPPPQRDPDAPPSFEFRAPLHEPGTRTVLGVRYRDDGVAQGEQVIRDLCRHPSTAQFIATKLVTHFVSDTPPPEAVGRIARAFRESDGDLRAVSRALVALPEAWTTESRKFRTPQDWLVAVLRGFDVTTVGEPMVGTLRQLRQPLWGPAAPKGFGDTMQEWADPDSLMNRAELARTFATRLRLDYDPRAVADLVDLPEKDPLRTLLADASISVSDRIALGISGPAFQWR